MKRVRIIITLIIAAITFGIVANACSSKKEGGKVPTNKKEIIDQFVAGTLDPSYVPVLFWGHFGKDQKLGEGAVEAHLSLYEQGGCDILKVQNEKPMPRIEDLTMESPLVPEDHYRPVLDVIKEIVDKKGNEVYVMPTILSTHQVALQAFGYEGVCKYAVERPEAYKRMLDNYTAAILWFIRECKAAGVESFFCATQGGEKKFYELNVPGGFFETYIKPYDLTRYLDYPGKMVNLPLNIDGKPLTTVDSYKLFNRPVVGGFNRKAEIGKAAPEVIAEMTRQIIADGPRGHLMVSADCSIPSPLENIPNVKAVTTTAHGK